MKNPLIAIDGPAGTGKSTVARIVARRLGLRYLDTGATYRAAAWKAMQARVKPEDQETIAHLCRTLELQVDADPEKFRIYVEGQDVTEQIRLPGVGDYASKISVYPEVRIALVAFQRQIAQERGIVVEGRDVQTIVCPDADLKVFITASAQERARRRWLELCEKHPEIELEAVVEQVAERDARDAGRPVAPMRPADDAVVIDAGSLSAEEAAAQIVALAGEPRAGG